jgi:type VI secretion system protein ImpH
MLKDPHLKIIQCVPRTASIPEDQRIFLGTSTANLGVNSYLGQEIDDRMGAFLIKVGPVDADAFHGFLPDTRKFDTMTQLIHLYLDKPLKWENEVIIDAREVRTTCLGEPCWSRLGWDTWIFSEKSCPHDVSVRFQGE